MYNSSTLSAEDVANDIHFAIVCLFQLTSSFDKVDSEVQSRYAKGIREQLTGLHLQITKYETANRINLQEAYRMDFVCPNVSKFPQPLAVILGALFTSVIGIERKHNYTLFIKNEQVEYAHHIIGDHIDELKNLI